MDGPSQHHEVRAALQGALIIGATHKVGRDQDVLLLTLHTNAASTGDDSRRVTVEISAGLRMGTGRHPMLDLKLHGA